MNLLANTNEFQMLRELHIQVNDEGIITSISSNCYELLGFTVNEIQNTYINEYLDCNLNNIIINSSIQVSASRKDGQKIHLDLVAKSLSDANNKNTGFELSCFEISSYIDFEKKYNSLLKMIENSKDIVFRYQLLPKPMFTYLSPSVTNILGFRVDEFYNDPNLVFNIIHEDDIKIQQSKVDKHTDFSKTFHVRHRHKNGYYVWIEDYLIPSFDVKGELISVEGISRNITERKELEKKLEKLSYHDGLTGLYNRTYLNKQIEMLTSKVDVPIGVIVCDLDNLKYINDSLGHQKGDILIKNVSTFFIDTFSNNYTIVRNGGDEFIILIPNASLKEAEYAYSKMLFLIEEHNKTNEIPIHLSSGFSYSPTSKNILEQLSRADKNMYKNKYEKKKGTR